MTAPQQREDAGTRHRAGVKIGTAGPQSSWLHNWNDENALRILRNLLASMANDGRVLLLDMLLPEDDRPHLGKEMDMRLLALYNGGRERGREEYLALLRQADLPGRSVSSITLFASG